jgi:hypothetical protein
MLCRGTSHNISASHNQTTHINVTARQPRCKFDVFMLICCATIHDTHHISIKTSTLHHVFRVVTLQCFMLECWSPSIDAHHISIKTSKLHHTFHDWCKFDVFMLKCCSTMLDTQHISIKTSTLHHVFRAVTSPCLCWYVGRRASTHYQHKNIKVTSHFPCVM